MSKLPEIEYQQIKAQGYTLAREFFPWGYCEMYKNYDTNHCLYYYEGALIGWPVLADVLERDWSPASYDDMAWKRNNVTVTARSV